MRINLNCPINCLSYGYVSTNILRELDKQGHEVCLFPIVASEVDNLHTHNVVTKCVENGKYRFSRSAPSLRIWHQHDMGPTVGTPIVGWPIFELNKFNQLELHNLQSLDKIIVCSDWAANIVKNDLPNMPVGIVPLGVNRNIFLEKPRQDHPFRVLVTGKAEYRKGHDIVPSVLSVLADKPDVEFVIAIENGHLTDTEMNEWHEYFATKLPPKKIHLVHRFSTSVEVAALYNSVDCGIFLSRAEGWNLPALEMLSCGKKIIITNYSAHTQYCNSKNSMLVSTNELETAYDGKFFQNSIGEWAYLGDEQKTQAKAHLISLYNDFKQGNSLMNYEGIETAKQFSWENSVKTLVSELGG